ncbi:MAG: carbohydrate-binding family 9-like protein, partial [Armatimonadota bacterium]
MNNRLPYNTYLAPFLPDIPHLDGNLNKSQWQSCPWSDDFVDIEGDSQPKPRYRTRMKMFWSDSGLYIGAEMEEPHLWATLTEHDSVIFHDNDFEVFIDPDNDGLAYAELEINALNTTWDLLLIKPYLQGGRGVDGWEIQNLRTAVQ